MELPLEEIGGRVIPYLIALLFVGYFINKKLKSRRLALSLALFVVCFWLAAVVVTTPNGMTTLGNAIGGPTAIQPNDHAMTIRAKAATEATPFALVIFWIATRKREKAKFAEAKGRASVKPT